QEQRTQFSAQPRVQCVGQAHDVPPARQANPTQAPEQVLLDVQIPTRSGVEVLDWLDTCPAGGLVKAEPTYAVRALQDKAQY
ncbi:DNA-binding response regulator, partial [Stenotrophomonas maltophilia]